MRMKVCRLVLGQLRTSSLTTKIPLVVGGASLKKNGITFQHVNCARKCAVLIRHCSSNIGTKNSAIRNKFGNFAIDPHQTHSLKNVLETLTRELTNVGVSEPEESVNLIVSHVFGKKMIHEVDPSVTITPEIVREICRMCEKRLDGVPVQYVIGEWDFHDMTLKMEPGILIPRPETEELATHVVSSLRKRGPTTETKVLDIGCGSGALSLYILKQLSNVYCVALDKNKKACDLTKANAVTHSLQDRLTVIQGDIFEGSCIEDLVKQGPFDVIVSNPPYIPAKDMEHLQIEVVKYEDREALCGGSDGLDVIRQILNVAKVLLKPEEGYVWLEVDLSHPAKVEDLVKISPQLCLKYLETIQDFTNRDRFCKLKLQNG